MAKATSPALSLLLLALVVVNAGCFPAPVGPGEAGENEQEPPVTNVTTSISQNSKRVDRGGNDVIAHGGKQSGGSSG